MCLASCRYVGTDGVYTHTVAYEKDPTCPICSAGVPFEVDPQLTLKEVGVRHIAICSPVRL